jgi:hypothetical protein
MSAVGLNKLARLQPELRPQNRLECNDVTDIHTDKILLRCRCVHARDTNAAKPQRCVLNNAAIVDVKPNASIKKRLTVLLPSNPDFECSNFCIPIAVRNEKLRHNFTSSDGGLAVTEDEVRDLPPATYPLQGIYIASKG